MASDAEDAARWRAIAPYLEAVRAAQTEMRRAINDRREGLASQPALDALMRELAAARLDAAIPLAQAQMNLANHTLASVALGVEFDHRAGDTSREPPR